MGRGNRTRPQRPPRTPIPPRTAPVSGTLNTLTGADLANLGKVRRLGPMIASIGGAGTFDGIFLAGTIAVLLAGLL